MYKRNVRGFTLIELMVVIVIIGILAAIVLANLRGAGARARDAERQSDLRNLEAAISNYKQKNGRYPDGCNGPDVWSGSAGAYACSSGTTYIVGIAPEFIPTLPRDPRPGTAAGYVYTTDTDGTVFKLMAMNTVESETVTTSHKLKSCDATATLCNNSCGGGAGVFASSYGVWGGYAAVMSDTTDIICK